MLRKLSPYLRRYKYYLLVGSLFVILKNCFQSLGPQVVRSTIDYLSEASRADGWVNGVVFEVVDMSGLGIVAAFISLFLGLEVLHGIFLYGMRQTMIVASRKVEYDLRGDLFGHLQKMHLSFFQHSRTGDLMSRLTNDLNNVRDVLGPGFMYTANTVVAFIYVVPMMIQINGTLTLLAFVPLVVLSIATQRLSRLIHSRSQRVQEKLSDISSTAQENFSGIRVVKSFVREAHEIRKFRGLSLEYIRLTMSMVMVRGVLMSSVILTIGLSVAVLLWWGGRLVIEGSVSLGDFTAFSFYLAMLIWPMIAIGWVLNIFQRGAASMDRLVTLMKMEPQIRDRGGLAPKKDIVGRIEFRHLTFSYHEDGSPVLKDINLVIEPGMVVGIVGPTGSGKSSLVSLLPRLHQVPGGCLWIDGTDIHEIPLKDLRGAIGMVPQDTFLFSDTILQNILFGVEHDSTDKALWASDVAQLRSNVEQFPEQFDTVIGERGITLSGGQKQRLAIARAILREPRILILDDALSSVDTHTEDEILSRLRGMMKGRTSLIVSHRLLTIQHADLIVVMDEGRIAERGTHASLLAADGLYAAMFRRQLLEQELETI